ncbi:putative branched-chain-amino-acid transaminase [Dictyocaulus viviparus]|uniref:Branched-chain-amino-acid aminotransferase n=1 Tax=Dictyocaulus viviparus TaxID=29172 RepID=A0A0D8X9U8_DICVI|nr:putative branched-chain-amino-acid transaminase [Dictyocaulus viviparus]
MNTLLIPNARVAISSFRLVASNIQTPQLNERLSPKLTGDPHKSFYHQDLIVTPATGNELHRKPGLSETLKFGHFYADHMAFADWDEANGWSHPRITPLRNLSIHPGSKVLHYASELFEGMKAYRGVDNKIRLFRPEKNMARMRRTARRAALPDFDAEELIKIICVQITLDQEWVPYSSTSSLYIRPTLIGTDPTLGVGFPLNAKLFVITGPVGQYYSTGFHPIRLLADPQYVRAFPGGVGAFKMGCNYAPTIAVGKEAEARNCQQVLWLYGEEEEVTEVGTMNIFVLWKNEDGEMELITPPLERGLILPGVTRDSLLELAREWEDFKVSEKSFTLSDVKKALDEGRLLEMFGAGTACIVSPIGQILYNNRKAVL